MLHAVRLRGMTPVAGIANRFDLDPSATEAVVLDQQAFGRLSWHEFGATSGWALTARGREHGEALLARARRPRCTVCGGRLL